jgi:hypothetical protein
MFRVECTQCRRVLEAHSSLVELKRVRILDMHSGKVIQEMCIENWTVLQPAC